MCCPYKVLFLHSMQITIKDLLSARTREEILATLDYFNALPRRQGRKEDLVKALIAYLSSDPKVWLSQLMECDLRLLKRLCDAGPDNSVDIIPADFPTVVEVLHFVDSSKSDREDMLRVSIPRAFYDLISKEIDSVISRKEEDGSFHLEHLILGAVNIYGVVPLRTFVDSIFTDFETIDEVRIFAGSVARNPMIRLFQDEYMGESYMISPDVENMDELMKKRKKYHKYSRRYAKSSLDMAISCGLDSPFCFFGRDTEEGKALLGMLEALGYVGEDLTYTAHLVWINSQYEPDMRNLELLLSPLTEAAADIVDYDQFVQYAQIILNYANSAPKWLLKGHSAKESGQMLYYLPENMFSELFDYSDALEGDEEVLRLFDSVNKVRPVAPDAPCPCGSGLSYRLCHGRHFS